MRFSMSAVDRVQVTDGLLKDGRPSLRCFPLSHGREPSPDARFHIFGVEVLLEMFGFAFRASELIHIDELLFILIFLLCITFICITSSPSIFMLCFFFFFPLFSFFVSCLNR